MTLARPTLAAVIVVIDAAALALCLQGASSWSDAGWASFLVLLFAPLKGVTYRRLGGRLPYASAIVATVTWQLVGLPIDLDGFWTLIAASFAVSLGVDVLVLGALGTGRTWPAIVFLGVHGSLMVHLFTMGFFVMQRTPRTGIPMLVLATVLFLLPAFFADRFAPDPPPP